MASYRKRTDIDQAAGELRHRVAFLHRAVRVNSGVVSEMWEPAFVCWASVEPIAGREYWQAAAVNRENEVRFTVRFRRDVDERMRVQFNSAQYRITSIVNPNARNVKLEILAVSAASGKEA